MFCSRGGGCRLWTRSVTVQQSWTEGIWKGGGVKWNLQFLQKLINVILKVHSDEIFSFKLIWPKETIWASDKPPNIFDFGFEFDKNSRLCVHSADSQYRYRFIPSILNKQFFRVFSVYVQISSAYSANALNKLDFWIKLFSSRLKMYFFRTERKLTNGPKAN
jgi:hypothetical protein